MDDEYDLQTLISYQRKELMSAKKVETDMDIAFNLQMQEAITASQMHSLNPHSQDETMMPTELSSPHFTDAILREIDNYEQERSDFQQSQSEMRKIKQNLSIQLHDQKYASEITRLSDRDWQRDGDIFEIPYGVGGSGGGSSDNLLGDECFRVYFKGIVDSDGRKRVGAVGVAICDGMDNLIFEVSKGVVDVEETEMSEERVELEGLIVGLDAALGLDFKRVEFFCDNFLFYQAIIGRCQPTEYSIANIIARVNLLRKRFVQCTPHLIARSDVKFAFRLARASMSSQLLKLVRGKDVKETCSICYEDRVSKLMFSVDDCGHRFCSFCIEQHLEAKLLHGSLPKCPSEGCKSGISIGRCQKLLAPKLLDIMSQRVKESTIPAAEKVYCPNPTCSMLMSASEVKEYSRTAVVRRQEPGSSRCIKCHELFCADCKVPWHSFMTCDFFRRNVQTNSGNVDGKLKSLAEKKGWSQCCQCKNMIELAQGCYHITCRCGFEFCYICGVAWKNKKPTCKCRLWDESNIIPNRNGNGRRN